MPFTPSVDGDTVKVDLTVKDMIGNLVTETVLVGADSSPPETDHTSTRFEQNTRKQIRGLDHFTSR